MPNIPSNSRPWTQNDIFFEDNTLSASLPRELGEPEKCCGYLNEPAPAPPKIAHKVPYSAVTRQNARVNDLATLAAQDRVIEFSVFTKDYGILTKKIELVDNVITKDGSQCQMATGSVQKKSVKNLQQFCEVLTGLKQNQAIALGIADQCSAGNPVRVVKKGNETADQISRSKDYFNFPLKRSAMLWDYDPEKGKPPLSVDEVYTRLITILPELVGCEVLALGSTSSGLYREGEAPPKVSTGGIHFYITVDDGSKIPAIGKIISERCWLRGFGRYDISKSGALLPRTLFDEAVFSPERLIFEAAPVLGAGLKQLPRMIRYWGATC